MHLKRLSSICLRINNCKSKVFRQQAWNVPRHLYYFPEFTSVFLFLSYSIFGDYNKHFFILLRFNQLRYSRGTNQATSFALWPRPLSDDVVRRYDWKAQRLRISRIWDTRSSSPGTWTDDQRHAWRAPSQGLVNIHSNWFFIAQVMLFSSSYSPRDIVDLV